MIVPRIWIGLAALLALSLGALLLVGPSSRADDGQSQHQIAYLSVSNEGPSAKAWYKGAPPAGVPVQDALDAFAAQGYHVAEVRAYPRSSVTLVASDFSSLQSQPTHDESFIILLER